ncbi:MAG TPA: DUF2273 domain-containing protein [Clostridiales bacterium]|nr:DUF2273 domain-containing protein [Clostridiales bacterium]
MCNSEKIKLYIKNNLGKVIGILIGLIFGVLVLSIGFWRSILLIIFICLGWWIGSKVDSGKDFNSIFDKIHKDKW